MAWWNAISQWFGELEERKIERHRQQGTCPDCSGFGFYTMALNEFTYYSSLDELTCRSCGGSGSFADWENR